jgi:hypothetical protein
MIADAVGRDGRFRTAIPRWSPILVARSVNVQSAGSASANVQLHRIYFAMVVTALA